MKHLKKILVFILSLALTAGAFFTSPIRKIFANSPVTGTKRLGSQITLSKLPTTGVIGGEAFKLPYGTTTDGQVVMTVKDSRGNVIFDNTNASSVIVGEGVTQEADHVSVLPSRVGTYTVQYKTINAVEYSNTTSQVYKIEVTGVKPTYQFATNTQQMIPSEVAGTDEIVLPFPVVVDSKGDEVATDILNTRLIISAVNPQHQAVTLTTKEVDGKEYYVFKPSLNAQDEVVYGTYTILYSYTDVNGLVVKKSFNVKVSENFSYDQMDLDLTFEKSVPTSLVLGNEVTLPTPTVIDTRNGDAKIDAYTTVAIDYYAAGSTQAEPVTVDGLTFTPMKKATAGAYYVIKYTVNTFASLSGQGEALTAEYTIKNVQDTEAPEVFALGAYEAGTEIENPTSTAYAIPTKIVVGETYLLPAIYGTDNLVDATNKVTLSRVITDPDSKEVIIRAEDGGEQDTTNKTYIVAADNETYSYEFTKAGTYYVNYTAKDAAGNKTESSYKVVVVEGNQDTFDTTAPVISMSTIAGNAQVGEVVTFKTPTAVDYVEGTKDVVDAIVQLNVYYSVDYTLEQGSSTPVINTRTEIALNEDGNYEFTVPTTDAQQLCIITEAKDDHGNISREYRYIDLINIDADNQAPTLITALPQDSTSLEQGERVYVPTLKFADDNYKYVNISVWVYDQAGNSVSVLGKSLEYDKVNSAVVVKNINFLAATKGVYTIVVTASDATGNTRIVSYIHDVPDTLAPVIELDAISKTAEVGVTIDLPKPVVKDDGVVGNYEVEIIPTGEDNISNYDLLGYKFTPKEEGTFTFKYRTSDGLNVAESAVYSITISDTIDPEVIIDDSIVFPTTAELKTVAGANSSTYESIVIPGFDATDGNNGIKETILTVKDPAGSVLLTTADGDGNYSFVPNKEGVYKVEYKAVDNAGRTTTITKTIKVGDCEDPTIIVTGNSNLPKTVKVNSQVVIDTEAITMTDNKDTNLTVKKNLKITLTGPDGTSVENTATDEGEFIFDIATAGNYKLVYTLTDNAGNATTKTVYFDATVASGDTIFSQETWGAVIIVLALIALGGIVIYFVKTKDTTVAKKDNK